MFAKFGSNPDLNLWMVLFPIVISICGLTLLSPPIATALVFMGHNLIGQITMAHPGLLIQVFPAGALILTLLYVRRAEVLNEVKEWKVMRAESWGLLAIIAIFMFGFFQAVFSNINMATTGTITSLFKSSQGGNFDFYPYVFMSRWSTFILIGALCCRGIKEIKIFLLALAIFVFAQLIAVPISSYQWVLSDMCLGRPNYTGLQALNVNRAYLGYLLACATFTFLVFAINEKKRMIAFGYYLGTFTLLFLCIIAGSKGPVAALAVAVLFLVIRGGMKTIYKLSGFGLIFLIVSISTPYIFGCIGGLQTTVKASVATTQSSIEVRSNLAKSEFQQAKMEKHEVLRRILGGGLGASMTSVATTFVDPLSVTRTYMSSSGSHNLFIDFFVDFGLLGLAIFISGLGALVWSFFRGLKHDETEGQLLKTLMGGVLLILLVYSILATAPSMATIQALFVGVLFGVGIKVKQRS